MLPTTLSIKGLRADAHFYSCAVFGGKVLQLKTAKQLSTG